MAKKEKEEVKKQTPEETPQEPVEETPKEKTPEEPKQKEISPWEEKYNSEHDARLRLAAEYDNFRKRTEREKAAIYGDGTSDAIKGMLPVADNLERALAQKECTVEDLMKGVEMVQTQFLEALKKLGVTPMGNVGDEFNPALHNAVSHIEDENLEINVISAVFQKGYMLGDKVVRHAMVQVAN